MLAKEFWDVLGEHIPDWGRARERSVATAELRQEFIHAHGVTLQALGIAGAALLQANPKNWRGKLAALRRVDWARSNADWEGRAMQLGRISKASASVQLSANYLKQFLGLKLSPEEQLLEEQLANQSPRAAQ